MSDFLVLYWELGVGVLFGKSLLVGDGLNCGVVVVLMNFSVDSLCDIL